ncbi:MAG: PAS domain S-box protein [Syntrophales bacterium]|nr:PAS domain S-box protein [Syntrophales bacterium]
MADPAERMGTKRLLQPLFIEPAALPVPLFVLFFAILYLAGPDFRSWTYVFEPPWLLFGLNSIFITGLCLLVAWLSVRSYLRGGFLNVLLLGCGVLAFGFSSFTAGWLIRPPYGPNPTLTVHNVGVLFASVCFFSSALSAFRRVGLETEPARRVPMAGLSYLGILLLVTLLTASTILDWTPPFFVDGTGPTVLRQAVLAVSVTFLAVSAILTLSVYRERQSGFLLYSVIAILLIGSGLGAIAMGTPGSPLSWLGRAAQYLGDVYLVIAATKALREARSRGTTVEEALADYFRRSETHYRALVEMAADAIVAIDREEKILFMNPAAEQIFGYRRQEAVGRRMPDLVVPEASRGAFRECLSGGSCLDVTLQMARKGGGVFAAEISLSPGAPSEADAARTIVIRDVTERKRGEKELQEAKALLEQRVRERTAELLAAAHYARSLLEASLDPLVTINREGRITDVNRATEQVTGVSRDHLIGTDFSDYFTDPDAARHGYRKAFTESQVRDYPLTIRHARGRTTDVMYHASVYRNSAGEILGIFAAARDVTEVRKAEAALREINDSLERRVSERTEALQQAKDYAETLIRTANILIIGLDAAGNVETFNDHAEQVTGYTRAEILGRNWFETVVPKDRYPRVWEAFSRLQHNALPEEFENPILTKDGRVRIISWRNSEIREADTVRGTISFGRDITDRRRLEEETRRLLAAVQEEKDRLSALINSMRDEVWLADTERNFTLVNPSALKEFGVEGQDGIDIEKLAAGLEVHRPDGTLRPVEESPPLRALKGEVVKNQEEIIRTPASGKLRYREVNAAPLRDAGGHIIGSVSVVRDITERKQAEEALRASELRMKAVADHLPVGVWFADEMGRIMYSNEAGRRIWGGARYVDPGEFHVYRAWWADTGKPLEPEEWAVVRAVRKGETSLDEVLEIECFDGTRKTILNAAVPLKSSDGSLLGVVVLNEDITERKQAEAALRGSRERFRVLAETAGELLKSEDPQRIVNALCEKVMGHLDCDVFFNFLAHDELGRLHLNAWAGIPPGEAARLEWLDVGVAVCGCVARDGEAIVAEHILTTPDARTELVRAYGVKAYACHPLLGPGGTVIGTLSFGTRTRDTFSPEDLSLMRAVTDQVATAMNRVRAEDTIRRAKEDLEEKVRERTVELMLLMEDLEKSRDDLRRLASELVIAEERERKRISVVLHDEVAQTLAATKMRLDLLRGMSGGDEYRKAISEAEDLIGQSIRQTRELMTDITNPVLYDMGLRAAVEALAEEVKTRQGISFACTFAGKLGSLDQELEVMIFQVVKELVQNVVKHSRARSAGIRIAEEGKSVRMIVADDGAGFDAGNVGLAGSEGGFGLFSIRERVKSYGGTIAIDSEPGKGARVTVTLPKTAGSVRSAGKTNRTERT